MIRKLHILTAITLISATAVTSCSDGTADDMPEPSTQCQTISFATGIKASDEAKSSRAALIEKDDLESFRVFGAQYEGNDPWNSEFSFYTINGDIVTEVSDGAWTTATPYYWPDSKRLMRFFAYAPVDIDGWINTNPEKSPEDARYYYAPPADPTKQVDILCSSLTQRINNSSKPNEKVQLWFHHALAQVVFDLRGTASGTVSSITLSGLTGCGGYHPTPGDGWWDLYDYSNSAEGFRTAYTVTFPTDGSSGDDQRLLVIPQTTPYGCKLEIRFRNGSYESRPFEYKTFNLGAIAHIIIRA